MNMHEIGRSRGRAAGALVKEALAEQMTAHQRFTRQLFPTLGDMDLRAAWRDYDRERLADEPDYTRFPEARLAGASSGRARRFLRGGRLR